MKLPFNEQFLQFVWQYQYFSHQNLNTAEGDAIEIIAPGNKNLDEGPDFINAKVKIGDIVWAGCVEIHLDATGWMAHKHQLHAAYNTVVLHVVYENNSKNYCLRSDNSMVPVLELKNLISNELITKGNQLFLNISPIPCSPFLHQVDDLIFNATLARTLTHRLERKSELVLAMLVKNKNDWEETTYQLISQHFGMKVNNEAFLHLVENLPLKTVLKVSHNLFSLEALFFGQAGFLEAELEDSYHQQLKKEYLFLKHKFNMNSAMQLQSWKHLRLHLYNFPELRIAQLAALYHKNGQLHSQLIGLQDINAIKNIFKSSVSAYWQGHYGFGKPLKTKTRGIGILALENLLINVVAALLVAYGRYKNEDNYIDNAYKLLESLPAENNKIVRQWQSFNKTASNAFESQALIELFNTFCSNKACLHCQIGVKILGRG